MTTDIFEELSDCSAFYPIPNTVVAIVVEILNIGRRMQQKMLTYMDHAWEDASIALRLVFGSMEISNGSGVVFKEP